MLLPHLTLFHFINSSIFRYRILSEAPFSLVQSHHQYETYLVKILGTEIMVCKYVFQCVKWTYVYVYDMKGSSCTLTNAHAASISKHDLLKQHYVNPLSQACQW